MNILCLLTLHYVCILFTNNVQYLSKINLLINQNIIFKYVIKMKEKLNDINYQIV